MQITSAYLSWYFLSICSQNRNAEKENKESSTLGKEIREQSRHLWWARSSPSAASRSPPAGASPPPAAPSGSSPISGTSSKAAEPKPQKKTPQERRHVRKGWTVEQDMIRRKGEKREGQLPSRNTGWGRLNRLWRRRRRWQRWRRRRPRPGHPARPALAVPPPWRGGEIPMERRGLGFERSDAVRDRIGESLDEEAVEPDVGRLAVARWTDLRLGSRSGWVGRLWARNSQAWQGRIWCVYDTGRQAKFQTKTVPKKGKRTNNNKKGKKLRGNQKYKTKQGNTKKILGKWKNERTQKEENEKGQNARKR